MDSTRLAPRRFAKSLTVQLRSPEGGTVPVASELGYDSSNPYAITIAFHLDDSPVPWTFGRELLSDGLTQPTGDGDVHVWPCLDDDGIAAVSIELCSPHGDALVEIHTFDAVEFLERSHALVPPGRESDHLDMDRLIGNILAAGNA